VQNDRQLIRDRRLIEGVLSNTSLLRGAAAHTIGAITSQCRTLEVRRNDTVIECNSRLPGIIAVAYGTLKLSLCMPKNERRVVRLVQAAQTFGEAAALTGKPAPYEARALVPSKLVLIPAAAVYGAIEQDPTAARQVLHALAERYFDLVAELQSVAVRRGAQRLAAYLNSIAEPMADNGWTARLPATKTVVASRLDMKKETLSRLLKRLSSLGVISVAGPEITIHNRDRLADLSSNPAHSA
jgi:CRP-like cAMP-binding protein